MSGKTRPGIESLLVLPPEALVFDLERRLQLILASKPPGRRVPRVEVGSDHPWVIDVYTDGLGFRCSQHGFHRLDRTEELLNYVEGAALRSIYQAVARHQEAATGPESAAFVLARLVMDRLPGLSRAVPKDLRPLLGVTQRIWLHRSPAIHVAADLYPNTVEVHRPATGRVVADIIEESVIEKLVPVKVLFEIVTLAFSSAFWDQQRHVLATGEFRAKPQPPLPDSTQPDDLGIRERFSRLILLD